MIAMDESTDDSGALQVVGREQDAVQPRTPDDNYAGVGGFPGSCYQGIKVFEQCHDMTWLGVHEVSAMARTWPATRAA